MTSLCVFLALSEKHAEARARGVAFRSVSLSRHDHRMHGRFGRYSKSETAKCRPVEDLSALNQTSGQERKQGTAKPLCLAKPAPDHGSKAYHSIIESPGTVKMQVFHFWTSCYIDTTARRERNCDRTQTTLSFLSRSLQWRVKPTPSPKYHQSVWNFEFFIKK